MTTIDLIVREINRDLSPQFEEQLRARLAGQDRDWLIDQIVRLTLDAHSLEDADRATEREAKRAAREDRLARLRAMGLDEARLRAFNERHAVVERAALIEAGHLRETAPAKGTESIGRDHRTDSGEALLQEAKDLLFGLLFGGAAEGCHLERTQQELLTFALPRHKAVALDFMRASTELTAAGTWQDPDSVSNDERADNVILEVQYGDTAEELVGRGIVCALSVINNLEVNEQILYARMINVEDTTLIT